MADWYFFMNVDDFRVFERWLSSEVRRVDLGSHLIPLAIQREHEGNYIVSQCSSIEAHKRTLTALSHLVLALAHVTHAIALLEGILAYGFRGCDFTVVWWDRSCRELQDPGSIVSEQKPVNTRQRLADSCQIP